MKLFKYLYNKVSLLTDPYNRLSKLHKARTTNHWIIGTSL